MLATINAHGPREFGDDATNVARSGSTPLMGAISNCP
jgi:hypothetical protein